MSSLDHHDSSPAPTTHFYLLPEHISGDSCRFSREESRHLVNSFRLKSGDLVFAADGCGNLYQIRLTETSSQEVTAEIVERREGVNELPVEIAVGFGLMTMGKIDQVIDQCTQLGVRRLISVAAARSVTRLKQERVDARLQRWRKVAIAAMKQSLRCRIPEIITPITTTDMHVHLKQYDITIIASMHGGDFPQKSALNHAGSILLLTGPEGGFSASEEESLLAAGARPVSLGPRRLRAELAPVVITAMLLNRTQRRH